MVTPKPTLAPTNTLAGPNHTSNHTLLTYQCPTLLK